MPTKITLTLDGTESKVKFTPKLTNENLKGIKQEIKALKISFIFLYRSA